MPLTEDLQQILVCPECKGTLEFDESEVRCPRCRLAYPIRDGMAVMLRTEARPIED